MTEHTRLYIGKGIPPVPGDTGSLESIEVLDLLNAKGGFAVSERGWTPKLPQTKNGGVYLDNPALADQVPVALSLGHVQETMKLTVTGSNRKGRHWLEKKLIDLSHAAQDFWTTETQIQPVWLCWQAYGATRPQYARIYDINIAPSSEAFTMANVNEMVITIDREHGWLLIPPGANPKWASYIINNSESTWLNGSGDASLYSITGSLGGGTCYNRLEFNTLYTLNEKPWIDVPANKIPGDLPALICIGVEIAETAAGDRTGDVYIAKTTNETELNDRAGNSLPLYNHFNASGANMLNSTTLAADASFGTVHNPVDATAKVAQPNFATTTEVLRMNWLTGGAFYPHLNTNVLRGVYAVFVRAWQVNGAAGICNIRLEMTQKNDTPFWNSGAVKVQLRSTGSSALHYMGMVALPAQAGGLVGLRGKGREVEDDFILNLYAQRTTSTGAAVLNIVDVILMPVSEGFIQIKPDYFDSASYDPYEQFYDNTGYLGHGKAGDYFAVRGVPGVGSDEWLVRSELLGGQIMLSPGVNNRLCFLSVDRGVTPAESRADVSHAVSINIVPRWSGVVDL